jgi:[FeFe] hydrogenase H-cluster maturation GTPase HydF
MNNTPKGNRIHIAVFGKRNVGKSSFLNAFTKQNISITSEIAGTTTDPVEKAYELQPIGPVLLIDTAGLDDKGELGKKRIEQTELVFQKTDLAIIILNHSTDQSFEEKLLIKLKEKQVDTCLILNKIDLLRKSKILEIKEHYLKKFNKEIFCVSAKTNEGIDDTKNKIIDILSNTLAEPAILSDLVKAGDSVLLVIPIDKEAPKGRLILPQVQTIRECLDADVVCTVTKDKELYYTLNHLLKNKPKLVITDSQVFLKASADVPDDILLTSFSILFARQKGDLQQYIKGVKKIPQLKNGDTILISELCSHRPVTEDIGRIKIPRWLKQHTGLELNFEFCIGSKETIEYSKYALIIQCGGCMVNRKLIMSRIEEAIRNNISITNYGIIIAYLHGILERALNPFPYTLQEFLDES